jgi:oligoendopeptidase F
MTSLSRRELIVASSLAGLAGAAPSVAGAVEPSAALASPAQWDLAELYPSDAAWDEARRAALAAVQKLPQYKGTLGQSPAGLKGALQATSDLHRTVNRIYTYASLKADEDQRVAVNQEHQSQAGDLLAALGENTAWIAPEILTLGPTKVEQFVAADPGLAKFRHGLADILRNAPHTLSPEGEGIVASSVAPLGAVVDIRSQLANSDVPWPTVTLSDGRQVRLDSQNYVLSRDAPNRADRKLVFDSFWSAFGKFRNSFGTTYVASVKGDIFGMKARKYASSLESAVFANAVPEAVYRTLIAETNTGLPQLHRYFELRRRLLGLPDLAYYDIYPPLVTLDRKFTLAEMRTTTLAAVAPLGKPYVDLLAASTAKKWMDPLPRQGKASGAYMNPGAYDVHPYLLLNLGENYDGMTTFAHEWGHAMHSLLANAAQPYETSDYPIFLAEIASTTNEQLLAHYMVSKAKTKQEKIFYLGHLLELLRGTFFRQAQLAEFELAAHDRMEAGEGLSGEKFTAIYLDLLKRYHGPKVTIDPAYAIEWAYIPHFFNAFYVYQYATSIAAAAYFAQSIQHGGAKERDTYLTVLKAGGSDYPTEILKRAGLDMTTPTPYRALVKLMSDTMDQVEALIA